MSYHRFIHHVVLMISVGTIAFANEVVGGESKTYDCETGCNLDPEVNGRFVCGVDGITYMNECLAICQNVRVLKQKPCYDERRLNSKDNNSNTSSEVTVGIIPQRVIDRFSKEGFKFVRRLDVSKIRGRIRDTVVTDEKEDEKRSRFHENNTDTANKIQAVRLTGDGDEYVANLDASSSPLNPPAKKTMDGYNPLENQNDDSRLLRGHTSRGEAVIGQDDRYWIEDTTIYPYNTIGQVGLKTADQERATCTGTVIGRNAILTAGHCVFDAEENDWIPQSEFTPGRNGLNCNLFPFLIFGKCVYTDPYDTWTTDYITTYGGWVYFNSWDWDVAVVILKPNDDGEHVGDVVGWIGVGEVEGYDDPLLIESTITGYPKDKTAQMWSSGSCPDSYRQDKRFDFIAYNDCDIFRGSSGSTLMGSDNRARGVVSFEKQDGSVNGAVTFIEGSPHFNNVCMWSGSCGISADEKKDRCDCPCKRWEFFCRLRSSCLFGYTSPYDCILSN